MKMYFDTATYYDRNGALIEAFDGMGFEAENAARAYKQALDHYSGLLDAAEIYLEDNRIYYDLEGETGDCWNHKLVVTLKDAHGDEIPFSADSYWYAVMMDRDDDDWGCGSYDLEKAQEMLRAAGGLYIAKIREGSDPVCVEEIWG